MVCQKLLSFLKEHPKNDKHTHIIYSSPGGSYTIPDNKLDEFYKLLHNSSL